MPRCAGITRSGDQCTASVAPGVRWCFNHDPARSEERRRNASRAGRGKSGRELKDVKKRLLGLAEAVLSGEVDGKQAAVAGQLLNYLIRAISVELKVREQEELIERIEELEALLEGRRGA